MKKILALGVIVVSMMLTASHVQAADLSSGDMVTIEKTQRNPLIFSNNAKIKSDVKGDLTIGAGEIEVDNSVENSAYLFGGTVNLKSPEIGNRLVIMGGDIKISSHIKGDLIVFGGNVSLESPTVVDGDIFAYGGNLYLRGQAASSVKTGGGKIVMEGFLVQKDMTIYSDQIIANDSSSVKGALKYYAKKPINLPSTLSSNPDYNQLKSSGKSSSTSIAGAILMLMLLGFFLVWIQKNTLEKLVVHTSKKFGNVLLAGFLLSIAVPIAIILLLITYVGIMAALALAFLFITAWIFGYVYGMTLLGSVIIRMFKRSKELEVGVIAVIIGSIVISLLSYVPIAGGLIVYIIALTGLGMAYEEIKGLK